MELRTRYSQLVRDNPRVRARDAATQLGVSEAELIQAQVGEAAVRLEGDIAAMITRLGSLGRVMALTRNDSVVHERWGSYESIEAGPHFVLVVGPDIDLRIFPRHWTFAYAVQVANARGTLASLQWFDAHGRAIHKVYLGPDSDEAAYAAFVEAFRAEEQDVTLVVEPAPVVEPDLRRPEDREAFLGAWAALEDTHNFFGLLKTHKVGRVAALETAEGRFAREVPTSAFEEALTAASAREVPIMVFVGNDGCIQIHTGPVTRIVPTEGWMNVLDPTFNLHARTPDFTRAFVVTKPTVDGDVTSLECFDAHGRLVVQLFGARKPGKPEDLAWRALAHGLGAV